LRKSVSINGKDMDTSKHDVQIFGLTLYRLPVEQNNKKIDADCSMESDKSKLTSAGGGRRRDCGYRYMMPSYAVDEVHDPATSYRVVADALLENSSAHGLPTLYRARGL